MDFEEFKERYLIYHEEFCFIYKQYKIEFVCEGNCYPVVVEKDDKVVQFEYDTPTQALTDFLIDGKQISEIWDELD